MSVIRGPTAFGHTTQRRVVGVTAAVSAAAVESLTVGAWFLLVVVYPRTPESAMIGLGVLVCGALLRAGIVDSVTRGKKTVFTPVHLGVSLVLTTCWIGWILVAERVGETEGVALAGGILAVAITVQFVVEWLAITRATSSVDRIDAVRAACSGSLVAIGASTLLVSTWYTDWNLYSEFVALGGVPIWIRVEAAQIGFFVFAAFLFLAHQYRFQRALGP